jgi:hypothetical protein
MSLPALSSFFKYSSQPDSAGPIHAIINSILLNSAFLEEACANGLAINRVENVGLVEFLNLIIFLMSNNFPGETKSEQPFKWLKSHKITFILKVISSMKGPTGEALLEKLFRHAIEAEDMSIVQSLIQLGINPNGHRCRHLRIPDHLTPLQFACIQGNTELAQELIKAGSSIDQPGSGWKSSA